MMEKMCPNCGGPLLYDKKTGLMKCKNGKCRHVYTLPSLVRRETRKTRFVRRRGMP